MLRNSLTQGLKMPANGAARILHLEQRTDRADLAAARANTRIDRIDKETVPELKLRVTRLEKAVWKITIATASSAAAGGGFMNWLLN